MSQKPQIQVGDQVVCHYSLSTLNHNSDSAISHLCTVEFISKGKYTLSCEGNMFVVSKNRFLTLDELRDECQKHDIEALAHYIKSSVNDLNMWITL